MNNEELLGALNIYFPTLVDLDLYELNIAQKRDFTQEQAIDMCNHLCFLYQAIHSHIGTCRHADWGRETERLLERLMENENM